MGNLAHMGPEGREHGLRDHLHAVALTASQSATSWRGTTWAYLAGLWHDLGKYRPGFQRYIRACHDAHIEGKLPSGSDKTHSAAGALHALALLEQRHGEAGRVAGRLLAYVIAGHHAGLADWTASLDARLLGSEAAPARREYGEALTQCAGADPDLLDLPPDFDLRRELAAIPGARERERPALSLWVRLLFSALVDADFLDTEAFLAGDRAGLRGGYAGLESYLVQLDAHLERMAGEVRRQGRDDDRVMVARAEVLTQCRAKALLRPGVFSLSVPTGGGKTLSSLAFALTHAVTHGKRRVIYAVPYTSIIEQTADVFGAIFGAGGVIEHHSQVDWRDDQETARTRLACENWDAPLVVTTNVQLFESLFANRSSRCRKLHNIVDSVIVLDEAQLLPPEFLQPILDTLHVLVEHYGVTLVLCTATQPVLIDSQRFDPRRALRGLPAPTRIVDDDLALFAALQRVTVEWPEDLHQPMPTDALVERIAAHECVLVIVNTRADAAEVLVALHAATGDEVLHLSAAMCGQHRADVIDEIRHRLAARRAGRDSRPLRVVSTQLVEAGVDIDFPVVFRALAGMDSIAQAAGRCNREGALPDRALGQVVVFVRKVPALLHGIRAGVDATRGTLAAGLHDPLMPESFVHYFPRYYDGFASRDKHGVCELMKHQPDFAFSFRTVAKTFRLIDDEDQVSIVVPYRRRGRDAAETDALIRQLRSGNADRRLMRALQRYTVNTRRRQIEQAQTRGDVDEVQPGVFVLTDELGYDSRLGLIPDGRPLDAASLVQ